jgi:hypothetical protein
MTNGRNSCHFLQLNTQRNPLFSLMAWLVAIRNIHGAVKVMTPCWTGQL